MANLHNQRLDKMVVQLRAEHPKVKWLFYDANDIFQRSLIAPTEYGFSNMQDTCYDSVLDHTASTGVLNLVAHIHHNSRQANACAGYFFFDFVHPTTAAHRVVAEEVLAILKQNDMKFIDSTILSPDK